MSQSHGLGANHNTPPSKKIYLKGIPPPVRFARNLRHLHAATELAEHAGKTAQKVAEQKEDRTTGSGKPSLGEPWRAHPQTQRYPTEN